MFIKKFFKGNKATSIGVNRFFDYFSIFFIMIYTIAAIVVSLNRYWQFQNFYFDFGIFDSAIWKVSRFQLPLVDHIDYGDKNILIFGNHFNPSVFLFSPLFWLTKRSEILLVVQSLCVSAGAYLAFLIAKDKIKNRLAVFSLIFAFLGYIGLQNALITDFHDATVAILPMMILFWAFLKRKWKTYFVCLLVILGLKESFAGFGVALSLFVLMKERKLWKVSLTTFLISFLWGYVSIKYVIPYFAKDVYFFVPKTIPTSLSKFVLSFFTPVIKVKTIMYSYMTFGLLPLFDLSTLPMIFENFFERYILSDGRGLDLGMHYNAPLSPIMFMGGIFVFMYMQNNKYLKKLITSYSILIIILVFVLHRFILRGPLGLFYNADFYKQNIRVTYVNKFLNTIPKDGLIMTQNDLATRFTHTNVKLLRLDYKSINPDTIVLNLTPGQNPNSYFPLSEKDAESLKDVLVEDENYTLKKYADELYLFNKVEK